MIIPLMILLSGCFSDTTDLQQHIETVKATATADIEPMPLIQEFNHYNYGSGQMRSPFILPKPESIQQRIQQTSDCLSPDSNRRRQPLEKFALDTLRMKGILGGQSIMWALVEASDKTIHRVGVGSYLGLFHGRVTTVNYEQIKIVELIPDGSGCWVERESVVAMLESNSRGQGK